MIEFILGLSKASEANEPKLQEFTVDNLGLVSSVVDPDPYGSVSFGRIRIRFRKR